MLGHSHCGPTQHNVVHIHFSTTSEKTDWVIDVRSDTNAALKEIPVVIQNIINHNNNSEKENRFFNGFAFLITRQPTYRYVKAIVALIAIGWIATAFFCD